MAVRRSCGEKRRNVGLGLVQMDNLRGLLGIRRMDRGPDVRIRVVQIDKWVGLKEFSFLLHVSPF